MATEAELKVELNKAMASGDLSLVMKLAGQLRKLLGDSEKQEYEAKKAALVKIEKEVEAVVTKGVEVIWDKVSDKIVDSGGDGLWFNFENGAVTGLRLTERKARTGGGGGVPKKFDMTSAQMLELYGDEEYKDGVTFESAWASAKGDKNATFAVRKGLIKRHLTNQG